MQNQSQSVAAVSGQLPSASLDGEIVVLERAFKQRQASSCAGQGLALETLLEGSNVSFLRKELPAGSVESLASLCADLAGYYGRAAKMCEPHAGSYALCLAAHKKWALLTDANNRLSGLGAAASTPHDKRRILGAVFDTILGASADGGATLAGDFKQRLNDDAAPVELRVGLASLFEKIRHSLRQVEAIKRAINEM